MFLIETSSRLLFGYQDHAQRIARNSLIRYEPVNFPVRNKTRFPELVQRGLFF